MIVAESEGFEPPDPLRSTVFKTAAFDHSANSPICIPFVRECKGTNNFEICKFILKNLAFFIKSPFDATQNNKSLLLFLLL